MPAMISFYSTSNPTALPGLKAPPRRVGPVCMCDRDLNSVVRGLHGSLASLTAVAIAVAIWVAGCSSMNPKNDQPALWRVTGAEGHGIWLFGSVHWLPETLQPATVPDPAVAAQRAMSSRMREHRPLPAAWYSDQLHTAFRRSETIIVESTDARTTTDLRALTERHEADSSCTSIRDHLSEPARKRLLSVVREGPFDENWSPRSAASALFALSGVDVETSSSQKGPGVDYWMRRQAKRLDKSIRGLESLGDRLMAMHRAFGAASCGHRAELIEWYLDNLDSQTARRPASGNTPGDSVELWRQARIDVLAREMADFKSKKPVLHDAFIGQRNRLWLPRLVEQIERRDSALVVVGMGHLAGPDNLLSMLEERGYQVQRVQ